MPKRIVADYDSDDGRIITLKQQGYSDEYVAQRLMDEGRVRYVPKTVGSRWLRLRKALQEAEDEKLDDELSDWHVGEVRILVSSELSASANKHRMRSWKVLRRLSTRSTSSRYRRSMRGSGERSLLSLLKSFAKRSTRLRLARSASRLLKLVMH